MLRFIALQGGRAHENVEFHNAGKTLYIGIELLLQLENKHQIMQNNVDTQHKHMYSFYIGSLCNVTFPTARFTCIVTSQVLVEKHGTELFYRGREHL